MTYIPPNPNGSALSASSAPVVIASDQIAVSTKITNGTNTASVSPFGSLSTSIDPTFLFLDTFDGAVIDIANRWTSGGTVAPTQNGAVFVNPATTASATSALVSQPTFTATANSSLGIFVQIEATIIALGNYRFWGYGTAPAGVGTAAAPIQDGIGFEIDTLGVLRASVYASGTRTFTQTLTIPVDGLSHLYVVTINTGTSLFYRDTFAAPIALSQLVPNTQTLPFRIVSLNSASVTGTPTLMGTQAGVAEFAHQAQGISDGTYYWRKATVKQASTAPVTIDTALVVALSPTIGHVSTMITATVTSTATAETLITITKSIGLAATGTSSSTTVTTGKRFHIQAIVASARNSTGTTAGVATIKIRAAVAGATSTASPLQFTSSVALPAATTSVLFPNMNISGGFEIDSNSATNTYGVTVTHPQWVTGTVVATFDISIIGYEY
jgi:ACT domain-containing protein